MLVEIKAQAYLIENVDGSGPKIGKVRTEVIDTETNELFSDCKTVGNVCSHYLDFWNMSATEQVSILSAREVQ